MDNNSPHWENDRVTRAIQSLQGKFVLVGKRRVRVWHMWLVIGIAVGAIVGVLWVANNTSEFSKSKAANLPDLVVTDIRPEPLAPAPGTAVKFYVTVKNQGGADIPAGLSIGVPLYVDGVYINTWVGTTASFAMNQSLELGPTAGTWTATAGTHTLGALVDDANTVAESDENNNDDYTEQLAVGGGGGSTGAVLIIRRDRAGNPMPNTKANMDAPSSTGISLRRAMFTSISASGHSVHATDLPGFTEKVGFCYAPLDGNCAIAGFTKATCDGTDCSLGVNIQAGQLLKVVFKYVPVGGGGGGGTTYQASTDFSSTNGSPSAWSYIDGNGALLTYDAANPDCLGCYKGSERYLLIGGNGQHPGQNAAAIRQWTAPNQGAVHITGVVKDVGGVCGGDGVNVEIAKSGFSPSWSRTIADGDTSGNASFDFTDTVNKGSIFYFKVSKGANNWCDWTQFDPKIEFTAAAPVARKLTVKKTFLPGVSGTATLLLDGNAPNMDTSDSSTWNTITTGSHTLTVGGTVPKTFYAVCTNASDCFELPNEGATISFDHQFGQNDTIQVYLGDSNYGLQDGFAPAGGILSFLDTSAYRTYNPNIKKDCSVTLYTNATGNEYTMLLQVAQHWSQTGIRINPVYDAVKGALAPANSCEKVGNQDEISAFRVGDLNLVSCATGVKTAGSTFRWRGIANFFTGWIWVFHDDISVDTGYLLSLTGPGDYVTIALSTFSHELGHLLGLPHGSDPSSVMIDNPTDFPPYPSTADIASVQAIYPQCAPTVNNFSISLAPNPVAWQDITSPSSPQCGPNGNRINPNGAWFANLTIQAPSSGDIRLTRKILKLFDASNNLRTTMAATINWPYKKDTKTTQNYPILPNAGFVPSGAELTISGVDSLGNPVSSTASVNLAQGNHLLTNPHCSGGGDGFIPLFGVFFGGGSCSGDCTGL